MTVIFKLIIASLLGWVLFHQPVKARQALFSQTEPVRMTISADFKSLVKKSARSTAPYPATLTVQEPGQTALNISVAARGKSRRLKSHCRFPPLRVKFDTKPNYSHAFAGQKSLKLVTHCHTQQSRQKYVFLEYAAYRLLNNLTPQSLGARLALIDYVQQDTGKLVATRYGFFIEDTDDAAKRNGMKEIDVDDINLADLNADAAARTVLFQYMISNVDFSMNAAAQKSDCCHNSKLMGRSKLSRSDLIPVPYDFDSTGLVSAPYAKVPQALGGGSLRRRTYRGFCVHNPQVRRQAEIFKSRKVSMLSEIDALAGLDGTSKSSAKKFLSGFFAVLENPAQFEAKIIAKCR